jgi:hypothetical protein
MNPAQLFSSLEAKYRLPEGYLSRVYQLESSSGKKLYNEQSGATGPFQFMPSTARGMGLQDPNDLAQSADAAARLAAQNRAYLQQNGIENVDGRVLYLAHVQGAGGAQRLLENADRPATAVVGKEPVVQNAGRPDQNAGEFAGFLMDRYQPTQGEAYSALGTSAPVNEAASAAPTQETSVADSGDERRRARALNTLLSISQGLQQESRPQPLPIPRLSYAEGGIVNFGPEVPGFWDGGFVDSFSYFPAYEPPSYSYTYTPVYEPPSYSYTPAYEPPSYSYTYTPVYETPIYTPPEYYTPPYTPPAYEYTYVGTPDFTQPPLVDNSMVYSTLDPNAPQYSGNLTYADVSSISPPLYTGGDYSYTGVSGPSGGDIYTGAPGYTGNAGSILQDALVDAGYAQPTEYIGVATNPPSAQPVFNDFMNNVVLPSFGIDPNATARPLTEAELAAQARGPLDAPENLVSRGDANLATVVGTGRPANEVAAEQAAARDAAAQQAARDQAALAAYQSGMSGIYGTLPEIPPAEVVREVRTAPPVVYNAQSFISPFDFGRAVTAQDIPALQAPPAEAPASSVSYNPEAFIGRFDFGREVTRQDIPALQGTSTGEFALSGPVGTSPQPTPYVASPESVPSQPTYSPSYINSVTNAFMRFNETGETVTREEAQAATRALLASREQGVTLSARAALEQGRAELSPPTQQPAPVSPPPTPSPEMQAGLLSGPTDTSAFADATFNPNFGRPPAPVTPEVSEGPTSVSTFPTDNTLGYTVSRGFTGQAPSESEQVIDNYLNSLGTPDNFLSAPDVVAEGAQDAGDAVSPYVNVPDRAINFRDFGANVVQQNVPQLGGTASGSFRIPGPLGFVPAPAPTLSPAPAPTPAPAPSPAPTPVSTGTLRIPLMPSLTESLPTFPTGGTVPTVRPYTQYPGTIFAGISGSGGGGIGSGGGGVAPVTPPTTPTPPLPEPSILYDLASFLERQPRPAPGVTPYVGIGSLVPPSMYVPEFGPSPFFGPVSPAGMRPISDANLPEFGPIPAGMRPISDANLPEFGPIPADVPTEQPT